MAETPLEEEEIRIDAVDGFRGDFAKLRRSHSIRQEFTTSDSAKFNGVAERHVAMVESAGIAAQVQARSPFRAFQISSGSRLGSERNCWACYALNRTATSSANVGDKSPFKIRFRTVTQSLTPFPKPGYVKTKHQDKLRPNSFPCCFIGPSANRPRDTYEVLLISGRGACHYLTNRFQIKTPRAPREVFKKAP